MLCHGGVIVANRGNGCLIALAVVVGLAFLGGLVLYLMPPPPPKTPQELKQEAEQRKAEERKEAEHRKREATILLASMGAKTLQAAMRDPASFKLNQVLTMESGATCYSYRSRNGFGGMNAGNAVMTPKGTIKADEMDGFERLWNHYCANKTGAITTTEVGTAAHVPYDSEP